MPRVTFTATSVVWLEVLGDKPDASAANRDDGGLIARLEAFLASRHIHPLRLAKVPHGIQSPGRYSYGFSPHVAPEITAWLLAHGATAGPPATGGET